MGLTKSSTGINAASESLIIKRKENERVIAVAGNPNVGKSTLFNALTGLKQHTGNWPGKTVSNAFGFYKSEKYSYIFVDIPGTYSLFAHSPEEEIARDFICSDIPETIVAVCDATCLERSLNLVLQILEIKSNVIVCVNLLDEAKRKGIEIDLPLLSKRLGVSVVGTVARKKKSIKGLVAQLDKQIGSPRKNSYTVVYPQKIEEAIKEISNSFPTGKKINKRWLSARLLCGDFKVIANFNQMEKTQITETAKRVKEALENEGTSEQKCEEMIASAFVFSAEAVLNGAVINTKKKYGERDRKIDKILTGKAIGYPVMILLLLFTFWLTISGANYFSEILSFIFSKAENFLNTFLENIKTPHAIRSFLTEGVFRVPAWVVSVMLPPMMVFFPLFTLLEDLGYLPRVAYNLDKPFKKCKSCGKQALTMCMGFGCNAAGVVGARIVDSKRERLLAIITNSLVPCNGRFPAIIAMISMFLVVGSGVLSGFVSSAVLTGVILFGVAVTFLATKFLSETLLKGEPSSYTLELPPYRRPQILRVIIRSVFDRTAFVLARALVTAVPAGAIIWLVSNVTVGGSPLLLIAADFLDPFAKLLGLDGVILIAFILGLPANEIVLPIIIMAYLSNGTLMDAFSIEQMKNILISNGWDSVTAICTITFSLFHWPCSTTLMTIKKETGSLKWTAVSVVLPTAIGIFLCVVINLLFKN